MGSGTNELECYESSAKKIDPSNRMKCFLERGNHLEKIPTIVKINVLSDIASSDTVEFYI